MKLKASIAGSISQRLRALKRGRTITAFVALATLALVVFDGTSDATGTFKGLPEGTTVNVNGTDRKTTYIGGDGNDVVLIPAAPPDFIVTKTDDTNNTCLPGDCSLREAIAAANANPDTNTITFAIPLSDLRCNGGSGPCTITLGGTELAITNDVNIDNSSSGEGVIVDANLNSRIFNISSGVVTISTLTITNGSAGEGGGISNDGTLTVVNSTITGNVTSFGGAGISNGGILTVIGSTISDNSASKGGGGIRNPGTLTVINSTISGNTAVRKGGGVLNDSDGVATITNTTITNNQSAHLGGAGICVHCGDSSDDDLILQNTIVAGNTDGTNGNDVRGEVDPSSFNNLIGDGSNMTGIVNTSQGNQIGDSGSPIDPKLGPLTDNGGPTQTHALLGGSPALEAGDDCVLTLDGCSSGNPAITTDQRGVARPQGNHVDIGAFELQGYIVTKTADTDNTCLPGNCSLREAIKAANLVAPDPRMIAFDIPTSGLSPDAGCDGNGVCTITPATDLPALENSIFINGYSQDGATRNTRDLDSSQPSDAALKIQLSGNNPGPNSRGLDLQSGSEYSVISGLIINHFSDAGIWIENDGGNQISGNFIGTNAAGTGGGVGNGDGVKIVGGEFNLIGGDLPADRNVISGNTNNGVIITGDNTNDNAVEGNYIGTDKNGAAALPNNVGVYINDFTSGNIIGCEVINGDNVISGNTSAGVLISESTDNLVEGNFIGTDKAGATALPNGIGVDIIDAPYNTVGVCGFGNLISGNTHAGVQIESSASPSCPSSDTYVQDNRIGVDRTGCAALPNEVGVVLRDSGYNLIGGTKRRERNLISGNTHDGILIESTPSTSSPSDFNEVYGNYIGSDVYGEIAIPNGDAGVEINGGQNNEIGCTVAGAGNLISGNTGDGVEITGGAANNFVQGNFIGVQSDYSSALGNGRSGVEVYLVAIVGGTTDNLIGADLNIVTIGDRATGRAWKSRSVAKPSAKGRAPRAVPLSQFGKQNASPKPDRRQRLKGSLPKRVTRLTTGDRFAVSATQEQKIAQQGVVKHETVAPPSSTADGANIIANNGEDGVRVSNTGDIRNLITGNSIYANNGLGINLGTDGVTLNDAGDPDEGPNHLQNFPVITGAAVDTQTITGILHSQSDDFIIDFYLNDDCDSSGYGEGKTYLGSTDASADGHGDATFSFNSPLAPFTANQIITATARDFSGNTSEFSRCFTATPNGNYSCPPPFIVTSNVDTGDASPGDGLCADGTGACTLRAAIDEANATSASCGPIDISFNIGSATIILTGGELTIKHDVNINGPLANAVVVSGNNLTRLFTVNLGYTASISNLTLNEGNGSGGDGGAVQNSGILTLANVKLSGNSTAHDGGAIRNDGTLRLIDSTLSGNSATGDGGAILSGSGRFATVLNTTISGNTSGQAGGGINSAGWLVINNSTISGNLAAAHGGGIYAGLGTATLTNVTITNNRSDNDHNSVGDGGGIFNPGASVLLHNTIVARNFKGASPGTTANDVAGALDSSSSFNLIGDGTGMSGIANGPPGNQIGTSGSPIDPLLGALQNNGGPTQTHGLLYNSPAVDAGDDAVTESPLMLTTDQRGLTRQADGDLIAGAVVDIGAYERQTTETRSVPGGQNVSVDLVDARLTFPCTPQGNCGEASAGRERATQDKNILTPTGGASASITLLDPGTQPTPPAGYVIGNNSSPPLPTFEVSTTATYDTPISVCFYLPSITDQSFFDGLKVLHREAGPNTIYGDGDDVLVDPGSQKNFAAKLVCAHVSSFSSFVIAHSATPTATSGNVSGQITDTGGNPIEGAAVRMTGTQDRLTVTDAHGNYRFENVETNGFYTVVPSRANFSFSPSQRSFSALGQHTDAAFNATATGNALNPMDTTEYFVRQQYLDFLGREPDESGLNFWVNNIESCGLDANCRAVKRIDTSAAFFLSIEFQQTGYLVYRTYQAAYGDMPAAPVPIKLAEFKPDTAEIGNGVIVNQRGWETVLENNKQAFAAEFVQRPRFTGAYPAALTPSEFVDRLFTNTGVMPAANERAAALNEFGSAATSGDAAARGRALRRVAENSTLAQQEFNQAFVLMQYFGYLQRDANTGRDTDFSGYNFWLDKLNSFDGNFRNAEMVKAFLLSGEYRGRFPR